MSWRPLDGAILLAVFAVLGVSIAPCWDYVNDDAYISFRYAANLLAGDGLVFNAGERVEGYTNFLWVMLMTPLLALGGPERIGLLAKFSCVMFAAGTVTATYAVARRLFDGRVAAACAAGLLALHPGFAANAVSGLETALFTALLVLALFLRLGDRPRNDVAFAAILALASLTRPEGFYLSALLLGLQPLARVSWRRVLRGGLVYAAIVVPYLVWKLFYYGALLPNTFYAKPGTVSQGLTYAKGFLTEGGFTAAWGLPLLAVGAGLVVCRRGRLWLAAFLLALVSAVVLSGGDWMLGWRFFAPALPFMALAMAAALDRVQGALAPRGDVLAVGVVASLVAVLAFALASPREAIATACRERGEGQRDAHLFIGHWLAANAEPDATVALMDIGMIGFHSELRVIDITGLTDPTIARAPGIMLRKRYDPRYVLGQDPDWIVLVSRKPAQTQRDATASLAGRGWALDPAALWFQDRRIATHPAFARHYDHAFSRRARHEGWLHVFGRKPSPARSPALRSSPDSGTP